MANHKLKTVNPHFKAIWNGDKRFELRNNDRNFKKDDIVVLEQFDPKIGYSGNEIHICVDYIIDNHPGLRDGYVIFGFFIMKRVKSKTYTINFKLKV